MLKRRSFYWGWYTILFRTFPSSWNKLRYFFHHLRGSTSRGRVEDCKTCLVHFSESMLMIISEHFYFSKLVLLHFALLLLHLMTNLQRKNQVHVNRRVTGSRVYILIFDLWDQLNIRGGRAAIVFIALLISLPRLSTAHAGLTVLHASNWAKTKQSLNKANERWLACTIA